MRVETWSLLALWDLMRKWGTLVQGRIQTLTKRAESLRASGGQVGNGKVQLIKKKKKKGPGGERRASGAEEGRRGECHLDGRAELSRTCFMSCLLLQLFLNVDRNTASATLTFKHSVCSVYNNTLCEVMCRPACSHMCKCKKRWSLRPLVNVKSAGLLRYIKPACNFPVQPVLLLNHTYPAPKSSRALWISRALVIHRSWFGSEMSFPSHLRYLIGFPM